MTPIRLTVATIAVALVAGCGPAPEPAPTRVKKSSGVTADKPAAEEAPAEEVAAKPEMKAEAEEAAPAEEQAAAASTAKTSTIEGPAKFVGRVVVKGDAPSLAPLLAQGAPTKDAFCAETVVPNEKVVASEGGGLANVFIYMKKAPKDVPAPEGEAPVLDQQGCVFKPHAFICRVGQPIKVINSDPVAHNVRITALSLTVNNILQPKDAEGIEVEYPRAERLPVRTQCDIHPWMEQWHLPVDHPWAAVTGADGSFEISNLPEGEWDFVIWHESVGYIERSFEVKAAPNTLIEQTFEVAASDLAK